MANHIFQSVTSLLKGAKLITAVTSAACGMMVLAQYDHDARPQSPDDSGGGGKTEFSLRQLSQRATTLENTTNPVDRDILCLPMTAFARSLDKQLPPDAKIFISGVLGPNVPEKAALYCVLRNYLFPREVEISADGRAVQAGSGFGGVPYASKEALQTNGFDVLVELNPDQTVSMFALSPKGRTR